MLNKQKQIESLKIVSPISRARDVLYVVLCLWKENEMKMINNDD